MIRFYDWATMQWAARQRVHRKSLAVALAAAVVLPTAFARAATIDWSVAGPENYDSTVPPDTGGTLNWTDTTQANTTAIPVSVPTNNPVSMPAAADDVFVRNGGTATISSATNTTGAVSNDRFTVGFGRTLVTDDGVTITQTEVGGNGTVNMTGGSLTGSGANGLTLRLGGVGLPAAGSPVYTGIFNQSGGTVTMGVAGNPGSSLTIGSQGTTPSPTSAYNLQGGTLSMIALAGNNNGINVRNGTFNMTGGSLVTSSGSGQRFMTISSVSGPATPGLENVATANFSGGVVNVAGGIRMANQSNTKAFMTISNTANLTITGSDIQMGANGTNSYAQVDMSGGSLAVGNASDSGTRRLIIGDSTGVAGTAGSTGVFNLSGGTVNLWKSLVVANNVGSKGTLTITGGSLTVSNIETNRSSGVYDLNTEQAAIIVNGPNAVFTQADNAATALTTFNLGQYGRGRFEILDGQANIREFRPSEKIDQVAPMTPQTGSRATINVFGGILRVQEGLNRSVTTALTKPIINLTGGELEFTPLPAATAIQWQADLNFNGTDFDPRPGGVLQTNLGNASRPADFSLNTGSIWDLNIANNTLVGGADWVAASNGTSSLNGGLINIIPVGGYTPAIGHQVRILTGALGVTLGAVQLSDNNWQASVQESGTAIYLTYVPEPSSMLLFGIGLAMFSASRRSSSRK